MLADIEDRAVRIDTRREDWIERAGLTASAICLVHCLALPFLFAALPSLSAMFGLSENFHLVMLAFAVPLSGMALVMGRARHGASVPLLVGMLGLVLLAAGTLVFGEGRWDTPVTVAGSLCLAFAHYRNWRLRHAAHGNVCTSAEQAR